MTCVEPSVSRCPSISVRERGASKQARSRVNIHKQEMSMHDELLGGFRAGGMLCIRAVYVASCLLINTCRRLGLACY